MSAVFNVEKMDRLIRIDRFLLHEFIDAVKEHPYEKALEIVFDTYVLEDRVMERNYNEA